MLNPFTTSKSSSQKKKKEKITVDGFEYLKPKSVAKAVAESIKPQDTWMEDWLGISGPRTVEMKPGVAYNPQKAAELEKQPQPKEAAIEYSRQILHTGEGQVQRENQESSQKIQMLIGELQRLAQSIAQIERTVIHQAIDPTAGKKTGKYYENFFEWMLMVVQDARRKVEDSGAWLSAMRGKPKRGAQMQKLMKTNMQVAMSGERTNANNTG